MTTTNKRSLAQLGPDRKYTYASRLALAIIFGTLFVFGIVREPQAYIESISYYPTAFASMVTWLVPTIALALFLLDMATKWLVEKSLRSLIHEADPSFQRMFMLVLMIAIPIMMLAAR